MFAPAPGTDTSMTAKDLLDYRQSILATIVTAFGAWVGAGAAYFFGRENLREATQTILQMREPSPSERLRQTPIREIPPRPVDWLVKIGRPVGEVMDRLKKEPGRWFIPIIHEDETLVTVLEEEAVFRYVMDIYEQGKDITANKTMTDVLNYLEGQKELQKRTKDIFVEVKLNKSAGFADDLMKDKGVKLGIITNENGKPTHFITTDDLRRVLMRESA
jgi:hypothetical protein